MYIIRRLTSALGSLCGDLALRGRLTSLIFFRAPWFIDKFSLPPRMARLKCFQKDIVVTSFKLRCCSIEGLATLYCFVTAVG